MGKKYEQICMEERCRISQMRQDGSSIRKIAATLDRSPSSIAREINRNLSPSFKYQPLYAQQLYKSRRWKGSKLLRKPLLQEKILSFLKLGWSPEQIAGFLNKKQGKTIISYESIYRFIYAQIKRTKDYSWRHLLPRAKSKRGYRGRKGGPAHLTIKERFSIHERPPHTREEPGHWEADLMSFSSYQQHLLVLHERHSRLTCLFLQPNKVASQVAKKISNLFIHLPKPLRKTICFDNGTEFAHHYKLKPNIQTFFCDPYSPWQKGSVENTIGRFRRFLPRKTNLDELATIDIHMYAQLYNHTPRKCLGYSTPAEVFLKSLLHFKCEFTSPPSRG